MADPKLDDEKKIKDFISRAGDKYAVPKNYSTPYGSLDLTGKDYYGPSGHQNIRYAPTKGNNFFTDVVRNAGNYSQSFGNWFYGRPQAPAGGGAGDATVGRHPSQQVNNRLGSVFGDRLGSAVATQQQDMPDMTKQLSLADALAQIQAMMGSDGGYEHSDIPFVNYDPQRQTARNNATEADYRLEAMYRQLHDSIQADEADINASYGSAIENANAAGDRGIAAAQAATDAATTRNNEVLANLGIADANAQIIGEGRDVNTQTSQQQADIAAGQAAAAQNLGQHQASSVQQNRGIANAGLLEGNLQRARNQAQLSALLAQIDMEEQGQNTGISTMNQQARQQASNSDRSFRQQQLMSALNMAGTMVGWNREDIERENAMLAELARGPEATQQQLQMEALSQLMGSGMIDPESMDPELIAKYLSAFK